MIKEVDEIIEEYKKLHEKGESISVSRAYTSILRLATIIQRLDTDNRWLRKENEGMMDAIKEVGKSINKEKIND